MTELQDAIKAYLNTDETKAVKKVQRNPQSALREAARKASFDLSHDLSEFKEYRSQPGKWTAFCHTCGAFAMVYDTPPRLGDQVSGKALSEPCGGRDRTSTLNDPVTGED